MIDAANPAHVVSSTSRLSGRTARKAIPPEFSTYLDVLRCGAALFVLFAHIRVLEIGPWEIRRFIPDYGHDSVILFFVLSGYVIAAAVDRKRTQGLREYALDRIARVYSVAVPTLLLCAALAVFFPVQIDPAGRWVLAVDHPLETFIANLLFVAQSWSLKVPPFVNDPYWSLCYEVMYYAAFGAAAFLQGRVRWVAVAMIAAIAGPKILLLLPCWALGVFAYHARDKWRLKTPLAAVIAFLVPPLMLLLLHQIGFAQWMRTLSLDWLGSSVDSLDYSAEFLKDYMTALIVAANLYAVRWLPLRWPHRVANVANAGASMSFTLYLMHFPLILLLTSVAGEFREGVPFLLVAAIAIPTACCIISQFTELRRPALRAWLERMLGEISAGPQPKAQQGRADV